VLRPPRPFSSVSRHLVTMPGTHLLPPNLLKLFAPRPPLAYTRPLDRDADRVTSKNVSAVGPILVVLRENATTGLINGEGEGMEEGEEPAFTLAEETKRQVRREERKKKRTEEFKVAKELCESRSRPFQAFTNLCDLG